MNNFKYRNYWTDEDTKILIELCKTKTSSEIAKIMGINAKRVGSKIQDLKRKQREKELLASKEISFIPSNNRWLNILGKSI